MLSILPERRTSPALSLAVLCCIATLVYALLSVNVRVHTYISDDLVDIDIGTNGTPMESYVTKLITFDPGDQLLISESFERYPFVIADYNGYGTFHINDDEPGCSSLNHRNDIYNRSVADARMRSRCGAAPFEESRLYKCMHPTHERSISVSVRRLSSFLISRGISRINKLKIDAQGNDFDIVKDFFEGSPHITLNTLQVECQNYSSAIPLYFSANDCGDILNYVHKKFPKMTYKRLMNNCMAAEYNIIMNMTG